MAPRLVTQGSAWVAPAVALKPEIMKMSAVDNQCAQIYVAGQWFMADSDNPNMLDPLTYFKHMKRGLARMMYEQPILAGVLRQDERGAFSVEIPEASQQGAKFHYLDMSEDPSFPSMDQLKAKNFPVIGAGADGLAQFHVDPMPQCVAGDPVLLAKLTRFRGGICVFLSITHLIGDLAMPRSVMTSMSRESALVINASVAGEPEPPLPKQIPAVLFDRTRLTPKVTEMLDYAEVRRQAAAIPEIAILDPTDPMASQEIIQNTFPKAVLVGKEEENEDYLRHYTCGMWRISAKHIEELRAMMQPYSEKKISIVDAIQTIIWQRFFISKYALNQPGVDASSRPAQTMIVYPGDVRRRLEPPLSPYYLGAAVDIFNATVPAETILPENNTDAALGKSLAGVAKVVRASTSNWSQDRYFLMLRLASQTPMNLPLFPAGPIDFFITDHTRTSDLLNPHWGYGLETVAQYVQPYAGREFPPGEVTLLQRQKTGDIDFMLCGERIVLQRLLQDPLLNRFAKNRFMTHNVPEAIAQEQRSAGHTPLARL